MLTIHSMSFFFFLVKCPAGTFHNSTARICQSCPFGQYQNATASLKCAPCPERTFTKRMHVKSLKDCIRKTSVEYNEFDVVTYLFLLQLCAGQDIIRGVSVITDRPWLWNRVPRATLDLISRTTDKSSACRVRRIRRRRGRAAQALTTARRHATRKSTIAGRIRVPTGVDASKTKAALFANASNTSWVKYSFVTTRIFGCF